MKNFDHPPRILFLDGSLRDRSYSQLVAEEAARIIQGFVTDRYSERKADARALELQSQQALS